MPSSDGRLHMRIPAQLKEAMKAYAERHNSNLTDVTIRLYTDALSEEQRAQRESRDAEQV